MANGNELSQDNVRVNFWMREHMHDEFAGYCKNDGRSISDVLRQLVSEHLVYRRGGVQKNDETMKGKQDES